MGVSIQRGRHREFVWRIVDLESGGKPAALHKNQRPRRGGVSGGTSGRSG